MPDDKKSQRKVIRRDPPVVLLAVNRNVPLLRGISDQAEQYGWRLLDLKITRGSRLPGLNPVGLLTGSDWDNPLVQQARAEGLPVVRVGHFPAEKKDQVIPAVLLDMRFAARMAAEHFAERGFRHLAYVGNYPTQFPWYNAFFERAVELGCATRLLLLRPTPGNLSEKERLNSRKERIADWLQRMSTPLGVFTYNDRTAVTIFYAAKTIGLTIPESVSLLGLGNDPATCRFFPLPLSSIDMNGEHWGREALRMLKRLVDGEPAPTEPLYVPPKGVVERQSTNLLAVPDPVVARALRFIWDHYATPLSIEDVASASAVSRSILCDRFKECLGRGVYAEIKRKRLEEGRNLLGDVTLTVEEVAHAIGFACRASLQKAFKKAFGITPGDYRRQAGQPFSSMIH